MIKVLYLVRDWCWLTRLTVLVPIAAACLCGAVLTGSNPSDALVVWSVLALCLVAAGGYVLNDVADLETDRVNHPKRALPSGRISVVAARHAGAALLVLSLVAALLVGQLLLFMQVLGALVLVLSYSRLRLRVAGWLGNMVSASLSVLPWTMPASLTGNWASIAVPAATTFLVVLSREILLDIEDLEGDRAFRLRTLPVIWDSKIAGQAAAALLALGCLVLALSPTIHWLADVPVTIVLLLGFYAPAVIIGWILLSGRREFLSHAAHLGKLQFCAGILAWWLTTW